MEQLRQTFKFGKWKSIYESEGDYAGRTILQFRDYGFKVHQETENIDEYGKSELDEEQLVEELAALSPPDVR